MNMRFELKEYQQKVLAELQEQLPYAPVGPDGRPDRRAVHAACIGAAAKLKQKGMHPKEADRVCQKAAGAAPRIYRRDI